MHVKKACLVINPRGGENVAKIRDILAVFSAAGWETDIAIKQYGGHAIELATQAAKEGCDLVIAYGGDGTVNQVVNGVMIADEKGYHSTVGVIPGGTVNLWATELGIPFDPIKAALTLVMSHTGKVDVGHVEVEGFIFPGTTQGKDNVTKSLRSTDTDNSQQDSNRLQGEHLEALLDHGRRAKVEGVAQNAIRKIATLLLVLRGIRIQVR